MDASLLPLDEIGTPMVVASTQSSEVLWANPAARELLERVLPGFDELPKTLVTALERVPAGEAIEWRPHPHLRALFGCTRYLYTQRPQQLILLKEISRQRRVTSKRLQKDRLESIGRLVASIAHELRNTVASIVYNTDLLTFEEMPPEDRVATVDEIRDASTSLQGTVDRLLDYARLGPAVSTPVSLHATLTRAQGFLRRFYGDGSHQMSIDIDTAADTVRGNGLVIEQAFVNLLLNAAQAADDQTIVVAIEARRTGGLVRVRVTDNGPGVPDDLGPTIFEPFVTTRSDGTGLGLTNAKAAIESLGGSLELESGQPGATFVMHLPAVGTGDVP
ncbi:MAG: HAMP domain-containing histidine kinase [Deltaproteobacteria bacterium]|nr:HAMP domain-containing histidine kinase [Deltaproteobacteria bacterium]